MNDLVMGLRSPDVGFILTRWAATWACGNWASQGVGISTTRSVVVASVLILSSDFFMTKILLMLFPVN